MGYCESCQDGAACAACAQLLCELPDCSRCRVASETLAADECIPPPMARQIVSELPCCLVDSELLRGGSADPSVVQNPIPPLDSVMELALNMHVTGVPSYPACAPDTFVGCTSLAGGVPEGGGGGGRVREGHDRDAARAAGGAGGRCGGVHPAHAAAGGAGGEPAGALCRCAGGLMSVRSSA